MPAPGALAVGNVLTQALGTAQVVLLSPGQLIGFFVQNATTSVVLYDTNSGSNLPTPILNCPSLTLGWYPFPVELSVGLTVTQSAGAVRYVVAN